MANFISSSENSTPILCSGAEADTDSFDDVCSICLEPFNLTQDPPTVTNCKHEYHLQCILEWSQRSKECPICWQILALKEPASQELLSAVKNERSLRSSIKVHHIYEDCEINHVDAPYEDVSEFDEHIMRNFAAAARRIRYVNRRERQRSSGVGPSQVHLSLSEEFQLSGYNPSDVDSATSGIIDQTPANLFPSVGNVIPNSSGTRDGPVKLSQLSPESPQRSNSSELLTFPESIKSKFSSVSARYKDSISKSTRGFKEKLLAHNSSVKDLSREVHREMSAGIASVAKMIERLDLAAKRTRVSAPSSSYDGGSSNSLFKGKGMVLSNHETTRETAHDMSSHLSCGQQEVSVLQGGN